MVLYRCTLVQKAKLPSIQFNIFLMLLQGSRLDDVNFVNYDTDKLTVKSDKTIQKEQVTTYSMCLLTSRPVRKVVLFVINSIKNNSNNEALQTFIWTITTSIYYQQSTYNVNSIFNVSRLHSHFSLDLDLLPDTVFIPGLSRDCGAQEVSKIIPE